MLKIMNVISDSNIGGAGRMLLVFLRNYDRSAIDMTVLLPRGALLIPELESLGIRYITDDSLAEQSFNMSSVKRLRELFTREMPDIVHTHASMSARIAARRAGCRVVYTRHSVFPNSSLKKRFPVKQVLGAVNDYYADAVIAVSPAARDLLIEAGQSPGKVSVIYNGVDGLTKLNGSERASVRAEYALDDSDFICGIFARLTPVKGHEYVLRAAELLRDLSDIKFVIAGTGEIENKLRADAAGRGLKNVVFTGFLANVERLMGACDLQLNASYGTEATSLALLEGMSMGIPAVVSSFGGNPYVITDGENGFLFAERDADSLADSIRRVYGDKELYTTLSENSLKTFAEKFTAAEMTRNIEKLYHSLV